MFKLKLINKPKMMKLKCNFTFPNVVLANLQEKEATPTKEMQQIIADQQYDGLSKVVVNAIPDEYIIPNGELEISQNGIYDVVDKASAKVNVPEKQLGTKTITTNGTYKATDDNVDGYSEVVVSTSGVDINDYYDTTESLSGDIRNYIELIPYINTETLTTMKEMFIYCRKLKTIPTLNTEKVTDMCGMFTSCSELQSVSMLDTSNVTDMNSMFSGCLQLKNIPNFDTSKVTTTQSMFQNCKALVSVPDLNTTNVANMSNMFYNCSSLETIPLLNTSKVTSVYSMFRDCSSLTTIPKLDFGKVLTIANILSSARNVENLGGFENLGAAYLTTAAADYSNYRLDLRSCTKLTHESLMNVINNLYDIKTKGCKAQSLRLGATNLAKLTDEEKQIAINKGWNVS